MLSAYKDEVVIRQYCTYMRYVINAKVLIILPISIHYNTLWKLSSFMSETPALEISLWKNPAT